MAINSVNSLGSIGKLPLTIGELEKSSNGSTVSFADFLNQSVNQTNDLLLQSERIGNDFATGKTDNIDDVMIAGEKADIALQFTMQIRNKILDAYNEIMRMQI